MAAGAMLLVHFRYCTRPNPVLRGQHDREEKDAGEKESSQTLHALIKSSPREYSRPTGASPAGLKRSRTDSLAMSAFIPVKSVEVKLNSFK
jgi:hypothetical protein